MRQAKLLAQEIIPPKAIPENNCFSSSHLIYEAGYHLSGDRQIESEFVPKIFHARHSDVELVGHFCSD